MKDKRDKLGMGKFWNSPTKKQGQDSGYKGVPRTRSIKEELDLFFTKK